MYTYCNLFVNPYEIIYNVAVQNQNIHIYQKVKFPTHEIYYTQNHSLLISLAGGAQLRYVLPTYESRNPMRYRYIVEIS